MLSMTLRGRSALALLHCHRHQCSSLTNTSMAARAFSTPNSNSNTVDSPRVCVVGSGPAGFYAAKYLLKDHPGVRVDMLEALPTPYGLVRSGVAPDHPEVKSVMNDFEKVAADERFAFLGNVRVGDDVRLHELTQHYHAVVLAYGAASDRELDIPGEHLDGVLSARAFVNWYNGHPQFRDLAVDLSGDTAVIFGQGNVAVDCARILTKSVDELASTDISQHAVDALRHSKIKKVYLVGRRGSAQAAFTMKEIRELTKLAGVTCVVDPAELAQSLTESSQKEITEQRAKKRMHELLTKISEGFDKHNTDANKQVQIKFLTAPAELLPSAEAPHRVGAVRVEKTRLEGDANRQRAVGTDTFDEIPSGLVLRSIGYKSQPLEDAPFDAQRSVLANVEGRLVRDGAPVPGLYCTGWVKRGPSGIIGANIVDARETVASMLEDFADGKTLAPAPHTAVGLDAVREIVLTRSPAKQLVSWNDFERLDAEEAKRGAAVGKPREKVTSVDEMLRIIAGEHSA